MTTTTSSRFQNELKSEAFEIWNTITTDVGHRDEQSFETNWQAGINEARRAINSTGINAYVAKQNEAMVAHAQDGNEAMVSYLNIATLAAAAVKSTVDRAHSLAARSNGFGELS